MILYGTVFTNTHRLELHSEFIYGATFPLLFILIDICRGNMTQARSAHCELISRDTSSRWMSQSFIYTFISLQWLALRTTAPSPLHFTATRSLGYGKALVADSSLL